MSTPSIPKTRSPSPRHQYIHHRPDSPLDHRPIGHGGYGVHGRYSPPRTYTHPHTVPIQPAVHSNLGHGLLFHSAPPQPQSNTVIPATNFVSNNALAQPYFDPRGHRYVPVDPFRRRRTRHADTVPLPQQPVVVQPFYTVPHYQPQFQPQTQPQSQTQPQPPQVSESPIIIPPFPASRGSSMRSSPPIVAQEPVTVIMPPEPVTPESRGRPLHRRSRSGSRSPVRRPQSPSRPHSQLSPRSRSRSPSRISSPQPSSITASQASASVSSGTTLSHSSRSLSRRRQSPSPSPLRSGSGHRSYSGAYSPPRAYDPAKPSDPEKVSIEMSKVYPELPSYPYIPPAPYPIYSQPVYVDHPSDWNLPPPATIPPAQESWFRKLVNLAADGLQELYLGILLGLPRMYFSRVSKIFTDAELYQSELEEMYRVSDKDMLDEEIFNKYQNTQAMSYNVLHLLRFKNTWEEFINGMITEWQVQNVVGVLLLSAVLTLLQIDDIGGDPLSRTTAIFSLVFALTALLHGCAFMARFGSMKKLYKAAVWAEEARSTTTGIIWNVWVFLALPTVWLAWSIIAFIVTVLSYVWRTGANEEHDPLSSHHVLGIRIAISFIFLVGFLYFGLALRTLGRYGSVLDAQWQQKLNERKQIGAYVPIPPPKSFTPQPLSPLTPIINLPRPYSPFGYRSRWSPKIFATAQPVSPPDPTEHIKGPYEAYLDSINETYYAFDPTFTIDLPSKEISENPDSFSFQLTAYVNVEEFITKTQIPDDYHFYEEDWRHFLQDLLDVWKGTLNIPNVLPEHLPSLRDTIVNDVIHVWNENYFHPRDLSLALVGDDTLDSSTRTIEISSIAPIAQTRLYEHPFTALSRITERTESATPSSNNSRRSSRRHLLRTAPILPPTRTPRSQVPGQARPQSRIIADIQLPSHEEMSLGKKMEKLPFPAGLVGYDVLVEEWDDFITMIQDELWNKPGQPSNLESWNATFFRPRQLLCSLNMDWMRSPQLVIKGTSVAR